MVWMSISTKTGDSGMTSLMKIKNISKSDDRIQLLGAIEELISQLGVIKSKEEGEKASEDIEEIQKTLITVMSGVADQYNREYKLKEDAVKGLEEKINRMESIVLNGQEFVLPGVCELSAMIDVARAVARRAERWLVSVDKKFGGDPVVKRYMNRLSDYLYILARYAEYSRENRLSERNQSERPKTNEKVTNETVVQAVLEKLNKDIQINQKGIERVNLKIAKDLIEKVEKQAEKEGLNAVIAVCGPDGNTIAVHAMDNAFLASFDIAMKKAYTAVAVRMSTKELGKLAMPGETFYGVDKADNGRLIIFGGGIPLMLGSKMIGGLGVSGGTSEQDAELAEYGLNVLNEIL
jgi:ATP:cob(I)alamin adenosyltransferase